MTRSKLYHFVKTLMLIGKIDLALLAATSVQCVMEGEWVDLAVCLLASAVLICTLFKLNRDVVQPAQQKEKQ